TGTVLTFPSIAGQDFTLGGATTINGGTRFDATVRLTGTLTFSTNTSRLNLDGGNLPNTNRIEAATVNGPAGSSLRATTTSSLTGFGTVNTSIDFLNDTELLADDGVLDLNGPFIELGTIGTADNDGTLDVALAWNTSLATELRMNGGTVTGATITNDGTTRGHGQITTQSFVNTNVTSADGGMLTLNSVAFPDLDGATEIGTINAIAGDINVPNVLAGFFLFDGTINVGAARQFLMENGSLTNAGTINMTAGQIRVRGFRHEDGLNVALGVSQLTELGGGMAFGIGSSTVLNGDLTLVGNAVIDAGATFAGPRSLIVAAGSTLRIANGGNVGVRVINLGHAEVGGSAGIALVANFVQTAAGTFESEIDGLLVGTQYDQLQVAGNATLAGNLNILVNQNGGVYTDPVGAGSFHTFTLSTFGSVAGDFDAVAYAGAALVPSFGIGPGGDFASLAGCGLFRIVDYSANDLQLINYRALLGDANADGIVDGSDFNIWNMNKFTAGTTWTSGDFNCDGVTDGSDFNVWNMNKFTGVVLPRSATDRLDFVEANFSEFRLSTVPEPQTWGFLVMASMIFLTRPGGRKRVGSSFHNAMGQLESNRGRAGKKRTW
ncbi:MAG TPA: hypothetical protein VIY86_05330, partial [Pirellulaceae bacterium]